MVEEARSSLKAKRGLPGLPGATVTSCPWWTDMAWFSLKKLILAANLPAHGDQVYF